MYLRFTSRTNADGSVIPTPDAVEQDVEHEGTGPAEHDFDADRLPESDADALEDGVEKEASTDEQDR